MNPVNIESNGDYGYLENEFGVEEAFDKTLTAGKLSLYIEPDGDVTPSQYDETVLGSILKDEWTSVWKKAKEWRKENK